MTASRLGLCVMLVGCGQPHVLLPVDGEHYVADAGDSYVAPPGAVTLTDPGAAEAGADADGGDPVPACVPKIDAEICSRLCGTVTTYDGCGWRAVTCEACECTKTADCEPYQACGSDGKCGPCGKHAYEACCPPDTFIPGPYLCAGICNHGTGLCEDCGLPGQRCCETLPSAGSKPYCWYNDFECVDDACVYAP